jgi:hypothetical protein
MCVKVFLADDAEIIRKAIRRLLADREDIAVPGEVSNFRETIQKTAANRSQGLLNGAKVLAISLSKDDETREVAASIGAVKPLDKMDLSDQLIPAILELGAMQSSQPSRLNLSFLLNRKAL